MQDRGGTHVRPPVADAASIGWLGYLVRHNPSSSLTLLATSRPLEGRTDLVKLLQALPLVTSGAADALRLTDAELAIAWILRRREVTAAIVGARRPGQIEETVHAGDWSLNNEEIDEIESLLADREEKLAGSS